MVDPLILGAYAASQWLMKNRRDTAAAEKLKEEKLQKQAEELKQTRVQEIGHYKLDDGSFGPPTLLNALDKRYSTAKITHSRIGTEKFTPVSSSVPLYQSAVDNSVGTEADFKARLVKQFGVFAKTDLSQWKLQTVGSRVNKDGMETNNWYPAHILANKEENEDPKVFIFTGTNDNNEMVFGRSIAEVTDKGAKSESIGQSPYARSVALELIGETDVPLPLAAKSFVTPKGKKEKKSEATFTGRLPDTPENRKAGTVGKRIYGDLNYLEDKKAVDIGQTKVIFGDTAAAQPIRTAIISSLAESDKLRKDAEEVVVDKVSVRVRKKEADGSVKPDTPIDTILRTEYDKEPNKYELVSAEKQDAKGDITMIDISGGNNTKVANALKASVSLFDTYYTGTDGKRYQYILPTDEKNPLGAMSQFLDQQLPKNEAGGIDFQAAGMDDVKVGQLARALFKMVVQDAVAVVDGVTIPSDAILNRRAQLFENSYPVISQVPGVKELVYAKVGIEIEKTKKKVANEASVGPEGEERSVVVAEVPSGMAGVTIPVAIAFDPKYNDMANQVLNELAPSGTDEAKNEAAKIFSNLVDYEIGPDGKIVRDAAGREKIARFQPDFVFLNYLTSSKRTINGQDVTLLPVYTNMLRPNSMKELSNDVLENDIKIHFTETVGDNFEQGMNLIMSFLPEMGTSADRIYFETKIEGTPLSKVSGGAAYEREKLSEKNRADATDRAVGYLRNMRQTFYRPDGSLIDMGTKMGQLYLALDGLVYMGRQAFQEGLQLIEGNAFGRAMGSFDLFPSVLDSSTQSQIELLAKEKGMTPEQYMSAEENARDEITAMMNASAMEGGIVGIDSDDVKTKNFALRNYYRYMVAYSVAAAIQGGTGGRTISDQDVLNVLNAFKMEQLTSQAKSEIAIIDAAMEMLINMGKFSRALSQGGVTAFAARKLGELKLGSHGGNYSIRSFSAKLEQPGKVKGTFNIDNELNKEQQLKLYNRGKPDSEKVTELPPKDSAEYKAFVKRIAAGSTQ